MTRLVIAAFWSSLPPNEVADQLNEAISDASLAHPRSGGVSVLEDAPDLSLRQTLASIAGLEDAAAYG